MIIWKDTIIFIIIPCIILFGSPLLIIYGYRYRDFYSNKASFLRNKYTCENIFIKKELNSYLYNLKNKEYIKTHNLVNMSIEDISITFGDKDFTLSGSIINKNIGDLLKKENVENIPKYYFEYNLYNGFVLQSCIFNNNGVFIDLMKFNIGSSLYELNYKGNSLFVNLMNSKRKVNLIDLINKLEDDKKLKISEFNSEQNKLKTLYNKNTEVKTNYSF